MIEVLTAEEAFDRDISAERRQDVMEMISEAAQSDKYHREHITISQRDRQDAINVRAEGVVTIDGREFAFIVRDGNNDGTVLEGWEESGAQVLEPTPRTHWALAPRADLVAAAIEAGKGSFLLAKWDAMLSQPEVAEIPRKYSYDSYVQPGFVVNQHWTAEAAKRGLVLTSKEDADETRARLISDRGTQ